MYLTRSDQKVFEIDDEQQVQQLLMTADWKHSTEPEIKAYVAKKEAWLARTKHAAANDFTGTEAFYQTVSASPDGYGMSRDILKTELFNSGVLLNEQFQDQKVGLLYSYPNGVTQLRTAVRLIMTMFESDKIPVDWPDYLKMADEVIVPSKWCADVFQKSGITTTVVPLGYNDKVFKYVDRRVPMEHDEPFTFIHYSSFNIRKGFFEVLEAFSKEFKHDEPVKLILKSTDARPLIPVMKSEYPNIDCIFGHWSEADLAALLGGANCMVYPSRGEGFGITPLEAMATGLPAIVPNAHGISEYFNSNYMLEVKADERCPGLYQSFKGQDVGEMVICDIDDLRKQMRYAYNHQAEMKELGKSASDYVKQYTYEHSAAKLAEIIKKWDHAETVERKDSKYLQVETI